MKIGELELKAGAPNAERLLASTGQTVAAMRQLLDGHLIAGVVAAALHACVETEHTIHELAVKIAAEGVDEVRALVREIYEQATPAAPPVPETEVEEQSE